MIIKNTFKKHNYQAQTEIEKADLEELKKDIIFYMNKELKKYKEKNKMFVYFNYKLEIIEEVINKIVNTTIDDYNLNQNGDNIYKYQNYSSGELYKLIDNELYLYCKKEFEKRKEKKNLENRIYNKLNSIYNIKGALYVVNNAREDVRKAFSNISELEFDIVYNKVIDIFKKAHSEELKQSGNVGRKDNKKSGTTLGILYGLMDIFNSKK